MMGSPMATLVLISVQISTSTTWAQGNRQHHLHVGYHLHELRYERGALVVHEVRQHVQMQMTVLVVLAPVVMPASGCKCR
jgi:hypothetical protein